MDRYEEMLAQVQYVMDHHSDPMTHLLAQQVYALTMEVYHLHHRPLGHEEPLSHDVERTGRNSRGP